MENRNTLRSQTVRCAHCGEYYSVTYDYCPFCDAGRKEAEKKGGSLFNTLFGAPEEEKKKRPSSEHSRREGGRRPRPEEGRGERPPREARPPREERPLRGERPAREERPHGERKRRRDEREEKRRERRPRRETPVEDELPRRKKTSEMTEAERAANRAEREARAAQRKRERERAAAEAEARERARQAEQAILARQQQAAGGESMGPVFETMTPPESFGFDTDAGSAPAPVEEGYETTHTGMTFRTFNIPLKGVTGPIPGVTEAAQEASQEAPHPPAPAERKKAPKAGREPEGVLSEEEASSWAALRSLEDTGGTVVEVTDDTSALVPAGDKPAAQEAEAPGQEQPVQETPVQETPAEETPVQEASAETVQPAADQGAKAPEAQRQEETEKVIPIQPHVQETKSTPPAAPEAQPEAAQAEPAAEPADPEQDLDALLNEIREMIANSPVPSLEELEEKEEKVEETAPASAESGEEVSEPTIVRTVSPPAQGEEAQSQEAAARPWKTEPSAAEEETAEPEQDQETLEERDTAVSFSLWKKKEKAEPAEAAEEEETGNVVQLKKKRNPLPLLLSLVVIAAAVFIVAGRFIPSLQGGVIGSFFSRFSQSQTGEDTAQTFTLKQNDLLFTEKGKTETLTPVFAPEGTTAVLGWSSSNPQVATVDENGLVTTMGPGTATITASMSSGESAQCIIRCNWKGGGKQPEDAGTPAEGQQQTEGQAPQEGAQSAVALSEERMTIDAAGDSKQLTLNGAAGEVTWSSSANTVATVSAEGLVTAVSVGGATITAACDGQTYTCEVRCIW